MDEGWIKISRGINKHWLWSDAQKLKWWLDLLLLASWDDNKVLVDSTLVVVRRGQMIASHAFLAKRWHVHEDTVKRFLRLLSADEMIVESYTKRYNLLTICNYESYQDAHTLSDTLLSTPSHTLSHTPTKEIKNNNREYTDVYSSSGCDPDTASSPEEHVDYAKLIDYWNTKTQGRFGKLRSIENNRRKMVLARIRQHGKKAFVEAIDKASASTFLSTATWFSFDWLICPNNFDKVISGNYDDRAPGQQSQSNLGPGEYINENGQRTYGNGRAIIPMDAPPRPSKQYAWNAEGQQWVIL